LACLSLGLERFVAGMKSCVVVAKSLVGAVVDLRGRDRKADALRESP